MDDTFRSIVRVAAHTCRVDVQDVLAGPAVRSRQISIARAMVSLYLYRRAGWTLAEIGAAMGLTRAGIHWMIHRWGRVRAKAAVDQVESALAVRR